MKFTQTMTMHMNGDKFSVLLYDVLCDGDEFDVLAAKGVGLIAWLEAHAKPKEPT